MDKNQWLDLLGETGTLSGPTELKTAIDGMSKQVAIRKIRKATDKYTKGFFRDTGWKHIHVVWKIFDDMDLDWHQTDNEYYKNDDGEPAGKIWRFEINFTTNKGKPGKIGGTLTAHGAGSVRDPLDRYDMTLVMW